MTNYVPGVSNWQRQDYHRNERKGYNDGEAQTGYSMLTYVLI